MNIRFGAAAVAAIVVLAGAYLGGLARLGADPAWAVQAAWLGIIPGVAAIVVLTALNLTPMARLILSLGGLVLALAVAKTGARRLAASFGEDVFAAQMWYLGWVGVAAAMILVISVVLTLRPQKS